MGGGRIGLTEMSDGAGDPTKFVTVQQGGPGPRLSQEESHVDRNGWALKLSGLVTEIALRRK